LFILTLKKILEQSIWLHFEQDDNRPFNSINTVITIRTAYQIYRNNEPTSEFYNSKWEAKNEIDSRNKFAIRQIMKDVNRMNGALRGRNRKAFEEAVESVANPPYTIVEIYIG
tara:strand:- start:947 stop:1285 length:339 start_codon:yes stop_codon:yes gene_type:complete